VRPREAGAEEPSVIVLRLDVGAQQREVRLPGARSVLGADAGADVVVEGAGWHPMEAVLRHAGTEVVLERPGGARPLRLRVGDQVRLGGVGLSLVGLLPLADTAPVFGDYDESTADTAGAGDVAGALPPSAAPAFQIAPAPEPPASRARPAARPRARKPAAAVAAATTPAATAEASADEPVKRPSAFALPGFGEEILRQLKRTPFFAASAALHVLVILVLMLLQAPAEGGTRHGDDGLLRSAVMQTPDLDQQPADELDRDGQLPAPNLPDMPDPQIPDDLPGRPEPDKPQAREQLAELELPDSHQVDIGLNPSMRLADARTGRPTKRMALPELEAVYDKGDAQEMNLRASEFLRAQLGMGNGSEGDPFRGVTNDDILVVDGSFDKIGRVLNALRLPYKLVTPASMAYEHADDLSHVKVVFWNCGEGLPMRQTAIVARRLRAFVSEGGYLFSTDWSVGNLLPYAFPGYLDTNGPRAPLPEMTIHIHPSKDEADNPLLDGVFRVGGEGQWWLEQASFDIVVRRKNDVTVLIESQDLVDLYNRSSAVAVTFRYGRGRVMHVAGHYYQESGNLAGTIASHRLALNFVLERLRALKASRDG
jgi:hypothetical protein